MRLPPKSSYSQPWLMFPFRCCFCLVLDSLCRAVMIITGKISLPHPALFSVQDRLLIRSANSYAYELLAVLYHNTAHFLHWRNLIKTAREPKLCPFWEPVWCLFVSNGNGSLYLHGLWTPSIWDSFADAGNMQGANGDIACDEYHKYKEDVQLMVDTGLEAYRFSISWSRLIPNGRGSVNPKGLKYYNNLINELVSNGIQPHVTLHHTDLPQVLEDEYRGWVSRKIVKDFSAFADACFREFGDRVLHWTTFNEANVFVLGGYDQGFLPPQRCSPSFKANCTRGNSTTEPYKAAHNILLAHASAARLYKKVYQGKQHGFIGFTLFSYYFMPDTNQSADVIATRRANDFYVGWFMNPLVYGDYPDSMRNNVGSRLPAFTDYEAVEIKGSFDFIGLNHYNTLYIKDNPEGLEMEERDFSADCGVKLIFKRDDEPAFEYPITPWGLQGLLEYFKQTYGNPPIYIHENGQRTRRNSSLNDMPRVKYMNGYIGSLLDALRNGSNVRGYFSWSFLDLFELLDGYESSYGLYYIDLDDPDLTRQPKQSAVWYSNFLMGGNISIEGFIKLESNLSTSSVAPLL